MKTPPIFPRQCGFTLIEVMVVIVIMGIIISLLVMNVSGIDHRRNLQFKEQMSWEFERIARESVDQAKILGLKLMPMTDVSAARYQVVELQPKQQNIVTSLANDTLPAAARYEWVESPLFEPVSLPAHMSMQIEPVQHDSVQQQQVWQHANERLPVNDVQMIWLGNGETRPSYVHFYVDQQALGLPLYIDYLGQVHVE